MWNRQQVKEQAKIIMKRNYWKMFVVTLIASTLTGEKTTIIERVQDFASNNHSYDAQPIFYSSNFELIFYSFISIASILGILYTIFIGNVIVVGKNGMETIFPRITDQLRKDFLASMAEIKDYNANIFPYPFAVDWLFDHVQKSLEKTAVLHPLYKKALRPRDISRHRQ